MTVKSESTQRSVKKLSEANVDEISRRIKISSNLELMLQGSPRSEHSQIDRKAPYIN
jgi:hypothetical protein